MGKSKSRSFEIREKLCELTKEKIKIEKGMSSCIATGRCYMEELAQYSEELTDFNHQERVDYINRHLRMSQLLYKRHYDTLVRIQLDIVKCERELECTLYENEFNCNNNQNNPIIRSMVVWQMSNR